VDGDGHYVAFDDQDRSQWDQGRIREGQRLLERAMRLRHPGSYQVQAAITALHLEAPLASDTDWDQIAELYRALAHISPSPIIDVNRAVAVAFARGPQVGLELLAPLLDDARLDHYQPLHAAHAELLRRNADLPGAARAYARAIELSANAVERDELERRLRALPVF
jgi:RNA polymerase sigma-70 factor (ECF subfamily)